MTDTERLTPTDLRRVNWLSEFQRRYLVWLLELYRYNEANPDTGWARSMWRGGVWIPRASAGHSRSNSASKSRAIRRLEDRGLIKRLNSASGEPDDGYGYTTQIRTTHIRLTDSGRALAERLTEVKSVGVNRTATQ